MNNQRDYDFKIELHEIHWLENYKDEDEFDRCAHGSVTVVIGEEIIVSKSKFPEIDWSLTAMSLHLLRTLEMNHIPSSKIGGYLVPTEGHHLDHTHHDPIVHIETAYPFALGVNWWVIHDLNNVKLLVESADEVIVPFETYRKEVLGFVDQVEEFYKASKAKVMPEDQYDKTAYLKLWKEWQNRRKKWNCY